MCGGTGWESRAQLRLSLVFKSHLPFQKTSLSNVIYGNSSKFSTSDDVSTMMGTRSCVIKSNSLVPRPFIQRAILKAIRAGVGWVWDRDHIKLNSRTDIMSS